ncbi:MAG: MarR family transcriptional regulator [Alphaproteobacteria bacterium]|nr:MAG: MarR family transcriptional regulator [Alphaproteobacteria bacterium]
MNDMASGEKYDRKNDPVPPDFRIINWVAIISQLADTKMRHLLEGTNVPLPQYVLLSHFAAQPKEKKTVSQIARALQQPQPGITKTVGKLLDKSFLRAEENPADGRSKFLYLTDKGAKAHAEAEARLESAMEDIFDGWREWEKRDFFGFLDRLKVFMEESR